MIHESSNMTVLPGNGSTTAPYPIPFRFDAPDWLRVTLLPQGTSTVEEVPLEPGTGYTVEMAGGPARLFTTDPVEPDVQIRIRRRTPRTQRLHPLPGGTLAAEDVERALDRLTMGLQDLRADGGLSTRSLTFPASEAVEDGEITLLPHQSADGGPDRRGTVLGFSPQEYTGAPPTPEHAHPGELAYLPTDTLLEALSNSANSEYNIDQWGTGEYYANAAISWLEERAAAHHFSISTIIVNGQNGTTFGYKGNGSLSADDSLTIQHGSVGRNETTSPNALSFRSTVIGEAAYAAGPVVGEESRDALVIGVASSALTTPNQHQDLTVVGSYALIYGYSNVALGSGGSTGGADAQDPDYEDTVDWTGHTFSVAVGAGTFNHGRENVILGSQSVTHGKRNCAFGHLAVANGYGMLALGASAVAQVPYADHPPDAAALAVGHGAQAWSWRTVAAGTGAVAVAAPETVAVGTDAAAVGAGSVALGHRAEAQARWSTVFTNGVAETGAWAASGFGYGSRLTLPESVEIIARGQGDSTPLGQPVAPGARAFLHPHHGLSLSHAVTALPPAATSEDRGHEPQDITTGHHGTLAPGMLTFHCDGSTLRIHLADGATIRTASVTVGPP
jgi:hypothetical protein